MAFLTTDQKFFILHSDYSEKEKVKTIPDYLWSFDRKAWIFPLTEEKFLQIKQALDGELEIDQSVMDWQGQEQTTRDFLSSLKKQHHVDNYLTASKLKLYDHQTVGVIFINTLKRCLLLDEMGLGKSAQALNAFILSRTERDTQRCLITCPKSLKHNWLNEILKHTHIPEEEIQIIEGTRGKRKELLQGSKTIWITSYDTLRIHQKTGEFNAYVKDQFLILDEVQYLKNIRAKRTKAGFDMDAKYKVLLTGTPVANHPEDLFSLIQLVKPQWHNFWQFQDRYIIQNRFGGIAGYRNLDDLKARLDSVSLRRLKSQVFDLPPKVYENRLVEMTPKQAEKYRICIEELRLAFEQCEEKDFSRQYLNFLTRLIRLNQISDGFLSDGTHIEFIQDAGKFQELHNIIMDYRDKIVVWCNFVPLVKYLTNKYGGSAVSFYGDMSEQEREEALRKFKKEEQYRLFIGQVATGGLGLNLTEAQTEIFFDLPNSPMLYLQAQDRCHRIGTTGTVSIIHLLSQDSIDLKIMKSIQKKIKLIDKLTGDSDRMNHQEMRDLLF